MLRWKLIMNRWHLTHDDISICQMAKVLSTQTDEKICSACVDTLADGLIGWRNLNSEFKKRHDG